MTAGGNQQFTMGISQIYCAVCGAPMLSNGLVENGSKKWLNESVLLTTAKRAEHDEGVTIDEYCPPGLHSTYHFVLGPKPSPDEQRTVLQLEAEADDTGRFLILDTTTAPSVSGKLLAAMCVEIDKPKPPPGPPEHGAPLYLPVHRACLELANRFISSTETSLLSGQTVAPDGITSIRQLWEVLYRRLPWTLHGRTWVLPSPQEYFGGELYRNLSYEPDDDPEAAALHEQNPIQIPDLTASVLQNLRPLDAESGSSSQDSEWFFEALITAKLCPWLWDLDTDVMREKHRTGHWDWTHLARGLTHENVIQPPASSGDNGGDLQLSLQLRNRRRIWRLLEEARVDDVATTEEELKAARGMT
ncbi:hypothetical protein M406DRAFT_325523 [Cryphonectria parasitica EP155]|uniref:Uncharacterized protein n=1 Tax=Cryphonectria parasitica (strain ATCC 38755 / EP155) TaxID=660469 RepID=A0A9P4YAJ1_CRYP1|nr:uncharacterized protein M406DRAFT_325523 [Cryphonectria parasitica EP155]KAF3770049.1 hypothetical protein M406DRAFT_325523 [Cryphonectria parasitica EP155]